MCVCVLAYLFIIPWGSLGVWRHTRLSVWGRVKFVSGSGFTSNSGPVVPPPHEGLCHSGLHAGILHPGVVPFLKNGEMLNPKGVESFEVHHTMIVRELSSPAYFTLFIDFNKVRHTGYQNRRFNVGPYWQIIPRKTKKLSLFHGRRPHSSVLVGSRAVVES